MLYEILASVTHNPHYLNKYIRFISNCQEKNRNYSGYTEKHHICPKAQDMFPEFTSFIEFPWNCVALTPRQHFIAHLLLHRTYPEVFSQARALYLLINTTGTKTNSKLYAKLKLKAIEASKGKVAVFDATGKAIQISSTDPRYLSGNLSSVSKGKIMVKDTNGSILRISNNDPRYLSGELTHVTKGKVTVCDSKGNTASVGATDTRYLSGELKPINKGKAVVSDAVGNTFQVDKTDTRYISGELFGITKGKAVVKDIKGNIFQVDITDSRYLSGELAGVCKGNISEKRILSVEQVKEIRLAIKNPVSVITNEYIASVVKSSQRDKIGKIPFEELKYKNGYSLTYKSLLANFYAEKFKIRRTNIINIIDGKIYKEITV